VAACEFRTAHTPLAFRLDLPQRHLALARADHDRRLVDRHDETGGTVSLSHHGFQEPEASSIGQDEIGSGCRRQAADPGD
jgi:hypothetical protein